MESMFTDEELKRARFRRFDVANYLKTAEDAKHYLASILEDGDEDELLEALRDIARSNAMVEIMKDAGFSVKLTRLAQGDEARESATA